MRLSTKLLTLLAATTAFTANTKDELKKRFDINLDDINAAANCISALGQFQDCRIDIINLRNGKDTVCNAFNSDKCQKVLKGGINVIPECKDLPPAVLATSPLFFEMLSSGIGLACSKDEQGNYCPLSDVIVNNNGKLNKNDEKVQAALNETCKSKQCVDAAVDTLTRIETAQMLAELAGYKFKRQEIQVAQTETQNNNNSTGNTNSNKSMDDYKQALEFFKSDNCTRIYAPVITEEDSSDAYSIFKLYSAFLVTFALVLPNFL